MSRNPRENALLTLQSNRSDSLARTEFSKFALLGLNSRQTMLQSNSSSFDKRCTRDIGPGLVDRRPFKSSPNDAVFLVVRFRCQIPRGRARQQYWLAEALAVDRVVMIMRREEAAQRKAAGGIGVGPFQGAEMCRGSARRVLDDHQ